MRSWKILDVKKFMNILLGTAGFDHFLLSEAAITGGVSYTSDGHLTEDFYSQEELENMGLGGQRCVRFGQVRSLCFDMIKGKRTPKKFSFVFLADDETIAGLFAQGSIPGRWEDVANLSLNIRYQNGELYFTGSCTWRTFTMDRGLGTVWEQQILGMFQKLEIALEEL